MNLALEVRPAVIHYSRTIRDVWHLDEIVNLQDFLTTSPGTGIMYMSIYAG